MIVNKTIATPKGEKSIHIQMTEEELAERARLEEESHKPEPVETQEQAIKRKMREKWPTEYILINDIIDRGIEAVRADKQVIIDGVKNDGII